MPAPPSLVLAAALSLAGGALWTGADGEDPAPPEPYAKTVERQFEYCGVRVVFLNPDLRPAEDGLVHATGWFFIQFQVVADHPSLSVDRLAFSFGKPIPPEMRTCDAPEWITGAYYRNYRVDDDPRDGFFIPINTTNVPDGEYAAALHVYSGGEEVGRMFTTAVVQNSCNLAGCRDRTIEEIRANDLVRPWPIVLPGDGEQVHPAGGLTLEFGEPVEDVRAFVDGVEVNLTDTEPREWDDDVIAAALDEDAPTCPACNDRAWGPAFHADVEVPEGAVVTVQATDLNGNTVSKILHLSSTTIGGVVSEQAPDLAVRVPEASKQAGPGETARFDVILQNVGRDEAHANLVVDAPDGVTARWDPNHVVVPSGDEVQATLLASGNAAGTHRLDAAVVYGAGDAEARRPIPLTLVVGDGAAPEPRNVTPPDEELERTDAGEEDGVPGPAAIVVALALGVAAARRRSFRRG